MTRSWNIVMTRILEHCDDKGGGHLPLSLCQGCAGRPSPENLALGPFLLTSNGQLLNEPVQWGPAGPQTQGGMESGEC